MKDEEVTGKRYITVCNGMRGFYATLIGTFKSEKNEDEYNDVINTSLFSYDTYKEAKADGEFWAKIEEIPFK